MSLLAAPDEILVHILFSLAPSLRNHGAGRGRATPRLRELRLRHWANKYTTHISSVHHMFLPTVEKLHGVALSWEIGPGESPVLGPMLSLLPPRLGLKHVDLVDSVGNNLGLEDLMSRSPDLQVLRAVWGGNNRMAKYQLWLDSIGDVLRRHGRGLEELALNPTVDLDYSSYLVNATYEPIGSLRGLTRLKKLTIPYEVLIIGEALSQGVGGGCPQFPGAIKRLRSRLIDLLPESLECLRLLGCRDQEDLEEQVRALLGWGGRFTVLTRIHLYRISRFGGDVGALGFNVIHNQDEVIIVKNSP